MRIYGNPYELISEALRDLDEMGIIVKPTSMQNKKIKGNEEFWTKEIQDYVYKLVSREDDAPLFVFEDTREWAQEEFIERIAKHYENPGAAWKVRSDIWTQFLNVNGQFDYSYNKRLNRYTALDLIKMGIERDPDSRQYWLPIFHTSDLNYIGGTKRIPCSLGYFFMVRGGQLNLTYIQRSADAVAHFGNDVWLAWEMMEYMAAQTGYKPGILTHHIFSLHSYKKDWDALTRGIVGLANYE